MSELDEDQAIDQQFEGKTYAEILEELSRLKRVSAELFVPALCVAYKREHINMENPEIKKQVMTDCLKIGIWTENTIKTFYPKWVNRIYTLNTSKFGETLNSPVEQQRQESIDELGQTFNHIEQEAENAEQEQDEQQAGGVTHGATTESKPKDKQKTPTELYEKAVKAAKSFWNASTDTGTLTAADTVDFINEHIKPSRQFRLRMLKGLDDYQYAHYQRVLVWLDKMIQDTLRTCVDINRENPRKEVVRK